jgi:nucleotidyltransferase/DNA polymerase involved in DNA repair
LAGGVGSHPLTDVKSIGVRKASRLKRDGIKNIKELSSADPQAIVQALGVSQETAKSLKEDAKGVIPDHSES